MADNLCGPSNALQNFQKHSNVDRTLQQDRLVGRTQPLQGFRTAPGPNAGHLDAEFAAFQAGHQSLNPLSSTQNFSPQHFLTHSSQPFQNASPRHLSGPGLANEFQNMNISSPQAQFRQQALHQTQQSQMGGAWHQEFAQSYGAPSSIAQGNQPAMGMGGLSIINPGSMSLPRVMQHNQIMAPGPSIAQQESFDNAAFERAFQEAVHADSERVRQKEQEAEIGKVQNDTAIDSEQIMADQEASLALEKAETDLLNQPPIGSDTIQPGVGAPDALSRTAGELLNVVGNDQSDKFQNSQFLQLMRQFRDKEVTVEGDKMVDMKDGGIDRDGEDIILHAMNSTWAQDLASRRGEQHSKDARILVYRLREMGITQKTIKDFVTWSHTGKKEDWLDMHLAVYVSDEQLQMGTEELEPVLKRLERAEERWAWQQRHKTWISQHPQKAWIQFTRRSGGKTTSEFAPLYENSFARKLNHGILWCSSDIIREEKRAMMDSTEWLFEDGMLKYGILKQGGVTEVVRDGRVVEKWIQTQTQTQTSTSSKIPGTETISEGTPKTDAGAGAGAGAQSDTAATDRLKSIAEVLPPAALPYSASISSNGSADVDERQRREEIIRRALRFYSSWFRDSWEDLAMICEDEGFDTWWNELSQV